MLPARKASSGLPSKKRLVVAAVVSLATFAASINLVFAGLVRMGAEFDVQPEILAALSSIYFACFFAISLLSGYLSDRFSARGVLLVGCAFMFLGGLIFASAFTPLSLIAGTAFMGFGGGVIEGMCSALLAQLFPQRARLAVNVSQAGYCLGAVVGPYLMGMFLPRGVNWRTFFVPVALLAALNFIFFATSLFPQKPQAQRIDPQTAARTLRRASVIHLAVLLFLYVFGEAGLVGFMNVYLFKHAGAPEGLAIQSISAFWAVMLVGRLLCGLLPAALSDGKLIFVTMTTGGLAVGLSLLAGDWPFALACFVSAGFLIAGAWPTIVALTAARHQDYASTVVGVTVAVGSLGCIVAPPIMGGLFQVAPPALVMALPGLPLLAGGVLALCAPRPATVDRHVVIGDLPADV